MQSPWLVLGFYSRKTLFLFFNRCLLFRDNFFNSRLYFFLFRNFWFHLSRFHRTRLDWRRLYPCRWLWLLCLCAGRRCCLLFLLGGGGRDLYLYPLCNLFRFRGRGNTNILKI